MKSIKICAIIFLVNLLIVPFNLFAQNKEVPITTTSKEALNFFMEGREKAEDFLPLEAAALFEKAIEKDPNFAMAYLYRSTSGGGYNIYKKNLDKAVSLMDKVSEGEKLLIQYEQANSVWDDQKRKECVFKLLELFPSDKRVQFRAGLYYYFLNEYKQAIVYLNKSIELDNKLVMAHNMLGYCNAALKNYAEAEKNFKTYISLEPNSPNAYDSYAELFLKMGKFDESIVQYKKALGLDPKYLSGIMGLANNYIFKGDFETARKYYDDYFNFAQNVPQKLAALNWKAISYIHEGNYQKAISIFDEYRALAEKENFTGNVISSYFLQGWIYSQNGNPAEGLKLCDKASELIEKSEIPETQKEGLSTNSYFWRFIFLIDNNDFEKAAAQSEKCKQRIAEKKATSAEPTLNLMNGMLELKKGDYSKAILNLSNADNESNPMTWYYLGMAYNKSGDKTKAIQYFEKVKNCYTNSMNLASIRKLALAELK